MLDFLGQEWFGLANRCFKDALPLQPGVDARLRYHVTHRDVVCCFGQVIGNGQIFWADGDLSDADVEVRWCADDAFAIFAGRLAGNSALAVTTIVDERPTGRYEGPPPPLDLTQEPAFRELPELPGADLDVVLEYTRAPFGIIHSHLCVRDGRITELALGLVDHADAAVSLPFGHVVRFERGEITVLELLRFGTVRGSEGALGLFNGLLESSECQRALRAAASGRGPFALAALGEVTSEPLYRDVMDNLLAQTRWPRVVGTRSAS